MNILFVSDVPFDPSYGGLERITDNLAKEFLKRGYNVYYLCHYSKCSASNTAVKQEYLPSGRLIVNDLDVEFYHNYLIENKIDIVINQRGLAFWSSYLFNVGKSNAKLVAVLHNNPTEGYFSLKDEFYNRNGSFQSRLKNLLKIITWPFSLFFVRKILYHRYTRHYKQLFQNSNKVILLSNLFIDELSKVYRGSLDKVAIIPNINTYKDIEVDFSKKEKILLYVGRLSYNQKRIDRLINIWRLIELDSRSSEWRLVIVGSGEEENKLKALVSKFNLKRVFFEGVQSDVINYYKTASIFALTSSYEGFPMSLGEAMINGCVPVLFDSFAAASDIVDCDVNGILVSPFDIEQYSNRVLDLMCNHELREIMARNAILKVDNFSAARILTLWDDLLISLCK
ncbi:MAG: glycosyltransferase [Tannerellaceae bacterium]